MNEGSDELPLKEFKCEVRATHNWLSTKLKPIYRQIHAETHSILFLCACVQKVYAYKISVLECVCFN